LTVLFFSTKPKNRRGSLCQTPSDCPNLPETKPLRFASAAPNKNTALRLIISGQGQGGTPSMGDGWLLPWQGQTAQAHHPLSKSKPSWIEAHFS